MKAHDTSALEEALGHKFERTELLRLALTHRSHAHENEARDAEAARRDNEQMEFLGDAVLGLVTSRELVDRYPSLSEGELSKLRAHLVSAARLAEAAEALDLGAYLRLGRGEEKSGGRRKAALLVDALEAVLAALYLEAGLEAARVFIVERLIEPQLRRLEEPGKGVRALTDFKSALQEFLQAQQKTQPVYVVVEEEGPEHQKTFTVEVRIHSHGSRKPEHVSRAQGPTKKKAEQLAAKRALDHLRAAPESTPE